LLMPFVEANLRMIELMSPTLERQPIVPLQFAANRRCATMNGTGEQWMSRRARRTARHFMRVAIYC
jgi:hypothetical protein